MRAPDFMLDGRCLDDGEKRHREAPGTFLIPNLQVRQILQPGDYAKLIFMIAVEGEEHEAVERMWVVVRERIPGGYIGMLNNEPSSIAENGVFWLETELPFEYRHIIAIDHANQESVSQAAKPAPIPWKQR